MNENTSQTDPSGRVELVEYLREQVRYLREEITQCRADIAAERQRSSEQLAQKDKQIADLLHLVESTGRTTGRVHVSESPAQAVRPVDKEPTAGGAETASDASAPEPNHRLVAARLYKKRSDVCPFLGANYDREVVCTYVTKRNACWSPLHPKKRRREWGGIPENHQAEYCLVERYTECSHFGDLQNQSGAN
jgi:hypothetical protein